MSRFAVRSQRRPGSRTRNFMTGALALPVVGGILLATGVPAAAEVPTGWTRIAGDSFSRTVTGQWGAADLGGAYAISGDGSSIASSGGVGVVQLASGHTFVANLSTLSAADVNVSDSATITGGSSYDVLHGWSLRRQSDGSSYQARVRFSATGTSTLGVTRINGSTSTWLGGVTLPTAIRAGTAISGEFQVTGTSPVTIKARAWATGATAPAWQVSYADTSTTRISAVGSVELRDYVQASSSMVTVNRDNLLVGAATGTSTDPTPTPADPAPVEAASSDRGSAPIGSASYAPVSGSIFVSPSGNDTNAGTQVSPYKTVAKALAAAAAGKTIVLRGGTYHESVASSRTVTLQNYPGEAVWFDGSVPISSWTHTGSVWVSSGWTAAFSSMMGGDAAFKQRFIGTNALAADPDQAFVNGSQLKQVAAATNVVAGTFAVNDSAHTITIGTDPSGKDVRGTNLARAVYLSGANSVIQGIGFRRYANGYEVTGAVKLSNTGGTIRNVVVNDVATTGISISSNNKTVDHVTVQGAGQLGIGGTQNDNSVVSNSIFSNNNTENFKDAPVAGGLKFTSARVMTVKNVDASNNLGSGIWFDVSSYKVTIVNNTANNNSKHGIEMEVSDTGMIANNEATNGGEDGIIVYDSANVKVWNNEVGGSSLFGMKIAQDQRKQANLGTYMEARDSRYKNTVDPNMTWITKNITVSNNVFGNGGLFQIFAMDGKQNRAVDTWNLTINGNLFNHKVASSEPMMVAWGRGDNTTQEKYSTPAALAAAKNSGWKNAQTTTSKPIGSMADDMTAFASTAVPIPADVAAATGLTAGAQVLGAH
jgi:parallel beta-helix repeat protein